MSKLAYRAAQRVKPCGEAGMAKIEQIVAEKQYAKVNEMMVDLYSASAVVAVAKALNAENRAKLLANPVPVVVNIAFRLCGFKGA